MAAPVPFADVHAVLTTCGITDAGVRTQLITNEGFTTLEDFTIFDRESDITEMAKR